MVFYAGNRPLRQPVPSVHRQCAGCCSYPQTVFEILKITQNSADELKGGQFVSVHPLTEQPWHSSSVALAAYAVAGGHRQ